MVDDGTRPCRILCNLGVSESNVHSSGSRPASSAFTVSISPCSVQRSRGVAPRERSSKGISSSVDRKDRRTRTILESSEYLLSSSGTALAACTRAGFLQEGRTSGEVCNSLRTDAAPDLRLPWRHLGAGILQEGGCECDVNLRVSSTNECSTRHSQYLWKGGAERFGGGRGLKS